MYGVNQPKGFVPFSRRGGGEDSGANSTFYLDPAIAGLNRNIYIGDVVYVDSAGSGTIIPVDKNGTGAVTVSDGSMVAGIFMGCSYTQQGVSSANQTMYQNSWLAGTKIQEGTLVKCQVCSDPDVLFNVQMNNTADLTSDQLWSFIFSNAQFIRPSEADFNPTQSSQFMISSGVGTGANYPFRIWGFTPVPSNMTPSGKVVALKYTNFLVSFNRNFFRNGTTGV